MDAISQNSWPLWYEAAAREVIDHAIRGLYDELGLAVAERRPVCNASGRCCRFEEYGHRLYVTGLEIAWFLSRLSGREADSGSDISLKQAGSSPNCPYQINGLCSTHEIRPLGCRVYFCEEGTEAWQQDTTERFLNQLKALHAEHDLPYAYMEWRAGLAEADQFLDAST
ncbi:MAG: hypothetical protein AAF085_06325 [Planctomycetota bacterium]